MNDSTLETPTGLPEAEPAAAAPKKPAAKRAPRKKKAETAESAAPLEAPAAEAEASAAGVPADAVASFETAPAAVQAIAAVDGAEVPELAPAEAVAAPADPQGRQRPAGANSPIGGPAKRGRDARKAAAPSVEGYQFEDVVSGRFDEDEASAEAVPAKRVLLPQVETPKLHKVLAQAGLGSRLEMEQLILEGRISVNNEPAHIGQRIQFGDQVKVNGKPIRYRIDPPPARVIAYHKPVGEVVTHDDPQNRPTVFRKLPRLQQGKWQSVGRLDLNTEGLLLFTSSGELANKLMHPRFGLEREYAVRVLGALSNEEKQKLLDGVRLDDGVASFG